MTKEENSVTKTTNTDTHWGKGTKKEKQSENTFEESLKILTGFAIFFHSNVLLREFRTGLKYSMYKF